MKCNSRERRLHVVQDSELHWLGHESEKAAHWLEGWRHCRSRSCRADVGITWPRRRGPWRHGLQHRRRSSSSIPRDRHERPPDVPMFACRAAGRGALFHRSLRYFRRCEPAVAGITRPGRRLLPSDAIGQYTHARDPAVESPRLQAAVVAKRLLAHHGGSHGCGLISPRCRTCALIACLPNSSLRL